MKQCKRCKIDKFLSEFHKNPGTKDGHRGVCKECQNVDTNARYYARKAGLKELSTALGLSAPD